MIKKLVFVIFLLFPFQGLQAFRGCERVALAIWSPRFEARARRDEGGVPPAAHNRGATPPWLKDGTPRRAMALLGYDCVAHRLRSALATRHSSLLVSLQNHLWQIANATLSQPLISGYYEHQLGGQIEAGDFSLMSHNLLRLDLKAEPAENIVFRANFIAQTFHGKTKFCLTEFMPEKFHPLAAPLPPIELEDRYVLDNAFLTFHFPSLVVRVGKQQLPWGTGYVWNPTNIFHPISILDPGIEFPGVEALRLDRPIGEDANLSFILASEELAGESTLALRVERHLGGFDLSTSIVNRQGEDMWLYGGDFVGELAGLGVWGEVAYNSLPATSYVQFVIGADYTTELQTHIMMEFHHHNDGRRRHYDYTFEDWIQLITGKRTNLARDYLFLRVSHPAMDHLMEIEGSAIINLNDESFIIIPKVTYNLAENVVITAMINLFEGRPGTEYGQFPSGMFVRARVYF